MLLTIILIPVLAVANADANADTETQLKIINPETGDGNFIFNPNTTNVGDTFTADVMVYNISQLFGWQVNITFNPVLINVVDIYTTDDHVLAGQTTLPVSKIIDNENGYVVWGLTLGPGGTPFSGSGRICQILFQIIKAPQKGEILTCSIHIDQEGIYYTQLLTETAAEIPFVPYDGYYDFSWPIEIPPAVLKITPARVVDPSLTPCSSFAVNISIIDANLLAIINVTLTFNSSVLTVQTITLGELLPPDTEFLYYIDNEFGFAVIEVEVPSSTSINGSGTLATLTFHVELLGESSLTLTNTTLINKFGDEVEHSTEDGYFNNMLIAKLVVVPNEIIDPTLQPPATFTLNITIDDVENLYQYAINLTFNPEVLSCIGLLFMDPLNETNYTPHFGVNNTIGMISVHVSYYEPAIPLTTYEPVTLFSLIFRVKGLGTSPIEFQNVSLFDNNALPIAFETFDGLFASVSRDIAILDISVSPDEVYAGRVIYINVTVKNVGDILETFNVHIYANDYLIANLTVEDLAPDEELLIETMWNTTDYPCGNYTIWAIGGPVPYETNLDDNTLWDGTVLLKLLGDINGDRVVNMTDVVIVIQAFGTYEGHIRWNPEADLNFDGKVDMKDITLVLSNFGKSY